MINVRLPLMSGEDFVEKVSLVQLMTDDRACCKLLTEAKDYHLVVSQQPLLQTNRTQGRNNSKSGIACDTGNVESYILQTRRRSARPYCSSY